MKDTVPPMKPLERDAKWRELLEINQKLAYAVYHQNIGETLKLFGEFEKVLNDINIDNRRRVVASF